MLPLTPLLVVRDDHPIVFAFPSANSINTLEDNDSLTSRDDRSFVAGLSAPNVLTFKLAALLYRRAFLLLFACEREGNKK